MLCVCLCVFRDESRSNQSIKTSFCCASTSREQLIEVKEEKGRKVERNDFHWTTKWHRSLHLSYTNVIWSNIFFCSYKSAPESNSINHVVVMVVVKKLNNVLFMCLCVANKINQSKHTSFHLAMISFIEKHFFSVVVFCYCRSQWSYSFPYTHLYAIMSQYRNNETQDPSEKWATTHT